ncbi:GNAT family N-acetyltransferase [Embleya sp. NBC_00888]|uniref:GNAT family N-acetyltransferase n=1 Tax=Embleya sp. NBC_00888 TaxID=2975960 RepID=UPI003867ABEF|nr:GNAT family N-acetyltransferase [Embleya sp. NBC_00888]
MTTDESVRTRGTVFDRDGSLVADYRLGNRSGRPAALDLRLHRLPAELAAPAILTALPGWVVSTGEETGAVLLAAGGRLFRHLHQYTRDLGPELGDTVWTEAGIEARPAAAVPPSALYDIWLAAYPPDHPDRAEHPNPQDVDDLYDGRTLGPLCGFSTVAVDEGRVVAAVLVNDAESLGPWISEVFRDPDPRYAGLGGRLLRHALGLAAADGLPSIGLAVTEGNPARKVYERLGFRHRASFMQVVLPGGERGDTMTPK